MPISNPAVLWVSLEVKFIHSQHYFATNPVQKSGANLPLKLHFLFVFSANR